MTITVEGTVTELMNACRALAGVCDGAVTEDNRGFNGCDSGFGKSLAAQSTWTPRQTLAAQKMLQKYRNQLLGYGIDLSALPTLTAEALETARPERPARTRTNRVAFNSNRTAVEFFFDYDFSQKEYVKNFVKARFSKVNGARWFKMVQDLDPQALAKYVQQYNPELGEGVADLLPNTQAEAPAALAAPEVAADPNELVELSSATDADISDLDLKGFSVDLFPFQRAGVKYATQVKKVLIGDDMGLGKTFQALATVHAAKLERVIVVCPASVKIGWGRAIATSTGSSFSLWNGTAGSSKVKFIVINYDNIKKHARALKAFGAQAIIFDEVHYLKNHTAQRTKVASELVEGLDYIIGLTGTPVMNRPAELISILNILGIFHHFGGWMRFVRTYCNAFQRTIPVKTKRGRIMKQIWDISGAANLNDLNYQLRKLCMVRRKKAEVLKELPTKTRIEVILPLANRAEYKEAETDFLNYFAASAAENTAFKATLSGMTPAERESAIRERQIEAAETAERAEQLVMVETLKQLAAQGMLDAMKEWITDFLETGEKLLVFAHHADIIRELRLAFPQSTAIVSEMDSNERQRQIDRFVKSDSNLLVVSIKAGGTGVDGLQEVCSNCAFAELDWTPAQHLQAEDRLLRIGQDNAVSCYYFLAQDTIYEKIQSLLAAKQAVCDSVLDGADEARTGSIFNELLSSL